MSAEWSAAKSHRLRAEGRYAVENWVRVSSVQEMPPGEAREVLAGDRVIALYRVGDQFHALDGICPHQGGPLGKGCLTGHQVTCPWHGWQFDVTTGAHAASPGMRQPRLAVKVVGDQVFVDPDS